MSEEMWLRKALFQKDSLLGGPSPVPIILGVGRVPEAGDTLPHAAWQCLAKAVLRRHVLVMDCLV